MFMSGKLTLLNILWGPTAPGWSSYPDEPGTADELLAEMDMHGVDWAVLVTNELVNLG